MTTMSTTHWIQQAEAALWRAARGISSIRMAELYMKRGLDDGRSERV